MSELRRLGQSELLVSPIGLGVMQFSGASGVFRAMFQDLSQDEMNAIVQAALDGGINWFDTAEMYGWGRSERSLANALINAGQSDGDVIIGTKWFPILRTARNLYRNVEKRIANLDGFKIDLYMVHQPWGFSPPESEMAVMADLVEAGKIRAVGVSNFNPDQMRRAYDSLAARGIPLAVNQVEYSLFQRSIEQDGTLNAARELGVTIVAWGPLASGLLTGKYHDDPELLQSTPFGRRMRLARGIERSRPLVETLRSLADNYEATPAQIALNWIIHRHGETVVAIPGASKVKHVREGADAMRFQLSTADLDQLTEIAERID